MQEQFAFTIIDDSELIKLSFNSNYNCPCIKYPTNCIDNTDLDTFNFNIGNYSNDLTNNYFNFGPDPFNKLENLICPPDFDYYLTHDFHKLSNKIDHNTCFSLFHSNICSLKANFDKLHNLLNNLDFKFNVIALSETWNHESKKYLFTNEKLPGYQTYQVSTGNSLKSGCGFFISDELKFISRKDLDIKYCDDDNEFQSKWIEIVNRKKINIVIVVFYRHPKKGSNEKF